MATLLNTAGTGTLSTDLFVNVLPQKLASALGCFDITSSPPIQAHGNVTVIQRRFVQVQARAIDPSIASSRCQAALDALTHDPSDATKGRLSTTVNGRTYQSIRALSSASLLGRDDETNHTVFYGEVEAILDLSS